MPSIKLIFDYRTPKKNGEIPLKIQVTHKRRTNHISLHCSLSQVEINKIDRGQLDNRLLAIMNEANRITNKAREISLTLSPFSYTELKRKLQQTPSNQTGKTLESMIQKKIDLILSNNQINSASLYKTLLNFIIEFKPGTMLKEVDQEFLRQFEKWYIDNRIKKSGRDNIESYYNTFSIYVRNLKAVINYARDLQYLDHTYIYPFGKNKYKIKTFDVEKHIFTVEEVNMIMNFKDFDNSYQENALNYWKLCFFSNGCNMVDLLQFKWTNIQDDILTFEREKTRNRTKSKRKIHVPLIRPLKELIDKLGDKECDYIFGGFKSTPKKSTLSNKVDKRCKGYNKHLKIIGEKLGLSSDLIIRTSRHSYGNYLAKHGISLDRIGEMMGHRDKNQNITYHYIGSTDKKTLFDTNKSLNSLFLL